ncbi:hypothetical protein KP509_25G026900 [Ceratopteris richardii]|uniref:Alliinase C-terminal domain-containing protein n=1 Tax=Ceratopteris richardii TaxID=49495 RepID=A0A8T2RNU1_CERRI|nr:hypothetical protein KP509_25G026900 [Ceratopteris richardii]
MGNGHRGLTSLNCLLNSVLQLGDLGKSPNWLDSESSGNWIPLEIVISPNNPDGSLRTPTWKYRNENARTVHDNAYYWPHYTPITGPRDDDFMLFSLSKVTGHAGSRLGWAIIKDRAVYEKMLMSVRLNTQQLLFHYGHAKMKTRWEQMLKLFQASDRFLIEQNLEQNYCIFRSVLKTEPSKGLREKATHQRSSQENDCCVGLDTSVGSWGKKRTRD